MFNFLIFPYVKKRKVELQLPEYQKAMLIFDVFRGQVTDRITKFIEENDCVIVHVPSNMTEHFKPLDLNVNGHAKEFLKTKFEAGMRNKFPIRLIMEEVVMM